MTDSPLSSRYASHEMNALFSPQFKHATWRTLWVELATAQKALGLPITESQIKAMRASIDTIDFAKASLYEKQFRHDVMAHIHTFGDACPEAKAIIHLGATSCFVTDNGDLIQIKEALLLIRNKLIELVRRLASFCEKQAELSCLSYTHFQPAQPTTVGRRAALWLQDFIIILQPKAIKEVVEFDFGIHHTRHSSTTHFDIDGIGVSIYCARSPIGALQLNLV